MNENLIKQTCKELGLTYRELGELIGYSEESVSKSARTGNISAPMNKAVELLLENIKLKDENKLITELSTIIKKLSK